MWACFSGPLPEPTVENKGLFHNRVDLQDSNLVFQFIASCKMESFGFWKHGRRNRTYYCFGCNCWDVYDEKWCSGASCPALTLSFWRKAQGWFYCLVVFCYPYLYFLTPYFFYSFLWLVRCQFERVRDTCIL